MNNVKAIIKGMTLYKRSDGRYEGRITVNGKRKSFYGTTKVEVKNKAKEYLTKVENGYIEPTKVVFNEYIEYWLKTYKKNKIQDSSYSRLYTTYLHQIKPTIGQMKMGNIKTKDIQNLIDEYANPTSADVKPLSLSGLKKLTHLIRPCMQMAVTEGLLQKNPCDNVVFPQEDCIQVDTKQQYSLSDDELKTLRMAALTKYKNGRYRSRDWIVLLIMLNTGLRVGEMLALTWKDIDFTNRTMHICKTLQSNIRNYDDLEHVVYYSKIKKSAKTKNGVRYISLNEQVLQYLQMLRDLDEESKIKSDYVACTTVGTMNCSRNLQRSLDRLVKFACIQPESHVSLHTLRHTFGSTLLRRGIGIEVISKLMGHANITITYNKYIHVIQEEQAKAMNLVNVC